MGDQDQIGGMETMGRGEKVGPGIGGIAQVGPVSSTELEQNADARIGGSNGGGPLKPHQPVLTTQIHNAGKELAGLRVLPSPTAHQMAAQDIVVVNRRIITSMASDGIDVFARLNGGMAIAHGREGRAGQPNAAIPGVKGVLPIVHQGATDGILGNVATYSLRPSNQIHLSSGPLRATDRRSKDRKRLGQIVLRHILPPDQITRIGTACRVDVGAQDALGTAHAVVAPDHIERVCRVTWGSGKEHRLMISRIGVVRRIAGQAIVGGTADRGAGFVDHKVPDGG